MLLSIASGLAASLFTHRSFALFADILFPILKFRYIRVFSHISLTLQAMHVVCHQDRYRTEAPSTSTP